MTRVMGQVAKAILEYDQYAARVERLTRDVLLEARAILRAVKAGQICADGAEVNRERISRLLRDIGHTVEEHAAGDCDCLDRIAAGETGDRSLLPLLGPQPGAESGISQVTHIAGHA